MNLFLSRLDEQQRRWYVALEAQKLGHGGATRMSQITGLHVDTIRRGVNELDRELADRPTDRVRLAGGGRQRVEEKNASLKDELKAQLEDEAGGDPMSAQKWIRSSLRKLKQMLHDRGYSLSIMTMRRLLQAFDYSWQANCKRFTGPPHPARDRQFRYIARVKKLFLDAGYPVNSVDAKKKELIGNFKNAGRVWCAQPTEVHAHDFPSAALYRAVPYGIYDLAHNWGYVSGGLSADTSEFAVAAIGMWWEQEDRPQFWREDKLLILGDAGGSSGYRTRLWKKQLQEQLADRLGIEVMVCHYPPGASKWNPIEHRLFSYISLNWAGKPLRTLETMLGYIRDTTTETGLKVKAFLVNHKYDKGIKVSDKAMRALNIVRRRACPNWNYQIKPRRASL